MINSTNIKGYINFLHLRKYNAPATEELQSRWGMLSDHEIAAQLQGLYQHWGIDALAGSNYEQEFYRAQTPPVVSQAPPVQAEPQAYNYPAAAPRSNKSTLYVVLVLLLALAGAYLFYKMNKKETVQEPVPKAASTRPAKQANVPQTATEPAKPVLEDTEQDGMNKEVIAHLLQAEETKDMSGILNCFSPDMQQYWDINYPSQEELTRRYNSVWEKSADGKHLNVRIKKTAENTYDMLADYEFFSIKDQVTKTVKAHVRYVFDNNNKIVKTYNAK